MFKVEKPDAFQENETTGGLWFNRFFNRHSSFAIFGQVIRLILWNVFQGMEYILELTT